MASSMALLLLLLAAVASTTAELDERDPHVELASINAELLKAVVAATSTTAELDEREPHVEPADEGGYKTYIILLEPPEGGQDADADAVEAWHRSFLPSTTTAQGKPRLLYSYRTVFTGFAAWLTEEELKELSAKPGFVRSFPNIIYRAQTTHTPSFLGLPNRMGEAPDNWPGNGGRGVIIGVIDNGIDDTHPSLEDAGFQDMAPPFWRGSCHPAMKCNKKLIGEKNMYVPKGDVTPPYDTDNGHGTHVATTAAGNFVANVSINGLAAGTASGVAPYAHLAIYKACGGPQGDCPGTAVLRAFDEAAADGVDIISVSISSSTDTTFDHDAVAIGSFTAMQKGIHVVSCAGNDGPNASSVQNTAPWLLTVGASTVDRYFPATVYLEGPADKAHDSAVGEALTDRMKLLLTTPPPSWKRLLFRTEELRRYCVYPFEEMRALVPDKVVICDLVPGRRDMMHKTAFVLMGLNASTVVFVEPKEKSLSTVHTCVLT